MVYVRLVVTLLALTLLGAASFQEKDKDKKPEDKTPAKLKGYLPPLYKKLGLRDDQTQKIYKIRGDFKTKTEELKRQIEKLKSDEKEALEKVLTPEQLKRLKELRLGEKSDK